METQQIVRVNSLATRSDHTDWTVIDDVLLSRKARDAMANPRKREIHFFHHGDDDHLHRMLNCLQPGSYIRPHRHWDPPKDEAIFLLKGLVGFVSFDDQGNTGGERFVLLDKNRGFYGIDWRAGVWHTFFALEADTVVIEMKSGPYAPATDKDFAPWVPEEGTPEGMRWIADLEDRFRKHWGMSQRKWD